MRRFFVATLGLLALIGTPTAMALGLGEIQVRSALNQPFVAQIPLLAVPTDALDAVRVKLADRADFERMGIERADYLSDLDFKVVAGSPPRIEVSAARAAREPFLTLLLDVRSATGRVLREYTVFLDPPPPIIAAPSVTVPVAPTVTRLLPQAPTAAPPPVPTPAVAPLATAAPAAVAAATPPPPAESSGTAAGADRYTVKPGETLWGVATAVRPDEGVDMNQVIYALVNANPTAFDRGRFEGLMKNVTLDVPRREKMLATPPEAARAGVAAWRRSGSIAGRATPRASVAPRRTPAPSAQATATLAPTATVTPSAAPAVSSVGSDAEVPAIDDSLSGEPVDTGSENAIDAAAALAAEGDAASAGTDAGVIGGGAASGTPASNGDVTTDTPLTGPTDAPADAPLDGQADRDTELNADDAASAEVLAVEPATAARDRPWWLILLLLFMLVLIALLLLRRRRDGGAGPARTAPGPIPQSPTTAAAAAAVAGAGAASATRVSPDSVEAAQRHADEAEALFMAAYAEEQAEERAEAERTRAQDDPGNVDAIPDLDAAQIIDEPAADSDAPPAAPGSETDVPSHGGWAKADALLSALDAPEPAPGDEVPSTTEGLDPLAEADTHVAFGLYDDALDTLDSALERAPQRADYLMKRAEVLLDAGRVRAFIAAASDARPHLDDAQWQSLAEAGRRVAPDEPLFATPGTVAAAPQPGEDPPPADDHSLPEPAAGPEAPERDAGLDFSFDESPTVPPPEVPGEPPRTPQARSDDDNLIDFDLNFDAPPAPSSATPQSPDEGAEGLHFDLSAFDETPPSPSPSTTPAATRDDGLEFDLSGFDLPPGESTPPPPAAPLAGEHEALGELDGLDDFKLDDFTLDEGSIEDADADSESLASGDEAATKLDLARAYVDMGDAEMARALLGEVLVEGNDTQQHEAQALMDRLG